MEPAPASSRDTDPKETLDPREFLRRARAAGWPEDRIKAVLRAQFGARLV